MPTWLTRWSRGGASMAHPLFIAATETFDGVSVLNVRRALARGPWSPQTVSWLWNWSSPKRALTWTSQESMRKTRSNQRRREASDVGIQKGWC